MSSPYLAPAIVVPFIAWRVYRRMRRNVGRQAVKPKRLVAGIVIFSVISALLAVVVIQYPPSLVALAGGLVVGAPLAIFGLRLTHFERTPEGDFYTPNTYIGVALTLLLVGRMIYRTMVLFALASPMVVPPPAPFRSPLTLFLFGVAAGYYIAFYAGVLKRAKP